MPRLLTTIGSTFKAGASAKYSSWHLALASRLVTDNCSLVAASALHEASARSMVHHYI